MTHRAELIMAAVLTNVTGLTTTGARVSRGRAYPVETTPALTVESGNDQIVVQNLSFIDREMDVLITAHVKTTGQYDTTLNLIREQVHIALMANRSQGLISVIIDTMPVGDEAPELTGDADKPTARQRMNWRIKYRHAVTNPGA